MRLLAALLAVLALLLAEFSWKCLIYYSVCIVVSLWLVHLFLANKYELDFDVVFKLFEWLGYGAPRFLEGRTLSTCETASEGPQNDSRITDPISTSVNKLIENVVRDFIASWYQEVADGEVFVVETRSLLDRVAFEIYQRMDHLDSHYLVEQVILAFHAHLERYNKSVAVLKDKDPNLKLSMTCSQLLHHTYESQVQRRHIALTNSISELNYIRTVVDTLLAALAPEDAFRCDMGRFILREILSVQAVELIDLLTEPDFVNEAIIDLLIPPKRKQFTGVDKIEKELHTDDLKVINEQTETNGMENEISSGEVEDVGLLRDEEGENKRNAIKNEIQSEGDLEQVQSEEGRTNDDLNEPDKRIIDLSSNGDAMQQSQDNELQSNSRNDNNKTHSSSFVDIPSLDSKPTEEEIKSSLTLSWGICPSPQDDTFQTQSFEAMKEKALARERKYNSTKMMGEIGSEVKLLGSCCSQVEESDEVDNNGKNDASALRFRSSSLPGGLNNVQEPFSCNRPGRLVPRKSQRFQRSVSFPANLGSASELKEQPCHPIYRHLRSSTVHPSQAYGSPYYNLSFCSSEASFKSFSDDDMNVEEGEEIDEGRDSDSGEILENIAPLPIMKPPRRKSILRQAEVQEVSSGIPDDAFTFGEKSNTLSKYLDQAFNGKITDNGFHSSKNSSQSSKDSDSSDQRSSMETTPLNTDSSFGDTVIMAGKKFISSIRAPVKFGFSSGSSKSTSLSSGADSMEVNVPSSIDTASFDSDIPFHRPPQCDSPSAGRKLSRSNAVIEISTESDIETCYGTPCAPMREEIVYGLRSGSTGDVTNGVHRPVVRIHPSQMICIPSSETALESEWEPGRSKFTLYRIEYDIRIWPSVYKTLIEEESQQKPLPEDDENTEKSEDKECKKKTFLYKRVTKRRYREFMELHSRLTNGPLAIYMKDILKPNRKYNLPFGRLDREVVEGRRNLLQYYLVSLVSKPELRDSYELQQFLGIIGGGSFIRPSVAQIMSQSVHVPRVDKMLSRQMTKVIDSIKTAFDSDDQEGLESGKVSPIVDIGCPWTMQCDGSIGDSPVLDGNQVAFGDCFSAFLENLELSSPSFYYGSDSESSCEDSSSDDEVASYFINQPTANDNSDIPNTSSLTSSISNEDTLNGVLGSQPPGLCIQHYFRHCEGIGSDIKIDAVDSAIHLNKKESRLSPSNEKKDSRSSPSSGSYVEGDAVDSGIHVTKKESRASPSIEKKESTTSPSSEKKESEFPPSSEKKPFAEKGATLGQPDDHSDYSQKRKSPITIGLSKKHVEKIKTAAKKVKEKKDESMDSLSIAKEKVKKKVPSAESLENIKQAKEKVKAFKIKIPNVESMENLSHAKEKVKAFKRKIPDAESLENITHAKEKAKAFKKKIPNVESMENLTHAKEKVKAFKRIIPDAESLENITHAKEKVKAFKKKMPNVEPMENLSQAKEKVKEFKKKIPSPQNLMKKGQSSSYPNIDTMGDGVRYRAHGNLAEGSTYHGVTSLHDRPEEPLVVSEFDELSQEVTGVIHDIYPEDLQFPLSHAILNLTCEVLKGQKSWAGTNRVQDGFLGTFGGLFEWFIRGEIDDVLTDQCWSEYLDNLNDVVWPNGKLIEPKDDTKSDEEKEKTKQKAVKTLMEFFPDVFELLVGSKVYKDCAGNAVESLQNPAINRILIYILLEVLLCEFVPELQRSMCSDVHDGLE